jgi:hypothetical protein
MSSRNTAIVTGASSGIGAVYADKLAKRGFDLVLVARNTQKLNAVAEAIRAKYNTNVSLITADLSTKEDTVKVAKVIQENASINLLVNNAGVGAVTPLLQSEIDQMEDMIDINVKSLTRLTYAAAPEFIKRPGGTIINIASIVGIGPEILNGVYGATKSYVLALTQSLDHELSSKGLRVQAVLPGAIATDFWDAAGLPHSNLPQEILMRADVLVDAALKGLDAGEIVTIPPLQNGEDWTSYEATRKALTSKFGHSKPGARYL